MKPFQKRSIYAVAGLGGGFFIGTGLFILLYFIWGYILRLLSKIGITIFYLYPPSQGNAYLATVAVIYISGLVLALWITRRELNSIDTK